MTDEPKQKKTIVLKRPENYSPPKLKYENESRPFKPFLPEGVHKSEVKVQFVKADIYSILSDIQYIIATYMSHLRSKMESGEVPSTSDLKGFRNLCMSLTDLNKEAREAKKLNMIEGLSDEDLLKLVQETIQKKLTEEKDE